MSRETILLVDDDKDLLATLSDFLQFEGYVVVRAVSGEEGLEKLGEMTPNLIILDISMPGIGGVGFLKQQASIPGAASVPVLVFTARSNMEKFFREVDVAGFLAKPCDPAALMKEIRRIIASAPARTSKAAGPKKRHGSGKVLVADDEGGCREAIVAALEGAGFQVVSVANGPEVVEKAVVEQPDIIVMKLVMEKMNGDTAASMLADMPSTKNAPIILYDDTGSSPRDRFASGAGSATRRFVRSTDPEEVVGAVKSILHA